MDKTTKITDYQLNGPDLNLLDSFTTNSNTSSTIAAPSTTSQDGVIATTIGKAITSLRVALTPTPNDWHIRAKQKLTEWDGEINKWFAGKSHKTLQSDTNNSTNSTVNLQKSTPAIDHHGISPLQKLAIAITVTCLLVIATIGVLDLAGVISAWWILRNPMMMITLITPVAIFAITLLAIEVSTFFNSRCNQTSEKASTRSFQPITNPKTNIDTLGREIKKMFSPLAEFNNWLDKSYPNESWHMQLASYLVKLPLRSVRNILQLLYNIIETILYTVAHPLNSSINIAKMIVDLIHSLTLPETWTKIGTGMIAMELGQLVFLANPVIHISIAIGAALLMAGLSAGALKAAIINQGNEKQAVQDNLFTQFKEIPECFLTGFFTGLIMGGIQRVMTPQIKTIEDAHKFADKYVRKHNLPNYREVRLHKNGKVAIDWSGDARSVEWFRNRYPKLFKKHGNGSRNYYSNHFRIVFPNTRGGYAVAGSTQWNFQKPLPFYERFILQLRGEYGCISRHHYWSARFTPLSKIQGL